MSDCIDRETAIKEIKSITIQYNEKLKKRDVKVILQAIRKMEGEVVKVLKSLPPVELERNSGHCKEWKYFEYDSVAKVNGMSLIVAHEICKRWGDGCKTKEDGYCFLYEPQESEDKA